MLKEFKEFAMRGNVIDCGCNYRSSIRENCVIAGSRLDHAADWDAS